MNTKHRPLLLPVMCMLLVIMLLNSCGGGANIPPSPPTSNGNTPAAVSSANVVSGTAVDTQGHPVSNAEVVIDGIASTSGVHEHYITQTDTRGSYTLPVANGDYRVHAFISKQYENATWSLPLNPTDNSNDWIDSSKGITKNFQWKPSGQIPGYDGTNYDNFYGATVTVNLGVLSNAPSGAIFTFTLTPNGPLIDGSMGQSITFQRTQQDLSTPLGSVSVDHTDYLCDIPIGDYTISGQVTGSDGTTLPIIFDGSQSEEISWANLSKPEEHVVNQIPVNISVGG